MNFTLPPLPYPTDALEPFLSKKTVEYHYGKHHAAYVENTNKLVEELVNNNVQFEMQLYPNRDESFTASLLQPHLFTRILNFIKGNIK